MNVLIVHPHIFAGGAEKAVLYLAKELNSMGHDCRIVTLSVKLADLPSFAHDLNYVLPTHTFMRRRITDTSSAVRLVIEETLALARLLHKNSVRCDVVNAHNCPSYLAASLSRSRNPVVWTCNEVFGLYDESREVDKRNQAFHLSFKLGEWMERRLVKGIDRIVTCSRRNAQLILDHYGLKSDVVSPGVDCDFFNDPPQVTPNPTRRNLIQVGSLTPRKNNSLSIRILANLRRSIDVDLTIVGRGSYLGRLQEEAGRLGMADHVLFRESVSEVALRNLYQRSDVNLFPCVDQSFGLVPFEALASGTPSVVSSTCGASEIFLENRLGPVREPVVADFAEAAEDLLASDNVREDYVSRGEGYLRSNMTWNGYAQKMLRIFENCVRR